MAYEDYIGKQFGNYRINKLVGKGGMAGVFLAEQPSMARSVAVKIMAQQYSEDDHFVARFKNEAKLIAQIEHAHILPVYDFGEEHGVLFIVMRYLDAGDLDDRITSEGMDIKEAARIFRQIALALDYAHSKGVIHRDIKPSNVMLDGQDNAFLTDFGIAKSLDGDENLTGTGGVVGTPTYMSPEQGMGDPVDSRSDIYAMGVMLFEMVIGKPPFTADNPMAVMLKHINEMPPLPSMIREDIPDGLSSVILRSMAKDPDARYATAKDMADALDRALSGGTIARPDPGTMVYPNAPTDTLAAMQADILAKSATMAAPVGGAAPATAEGIAAPLPAGTIPGAVIPPPVKETPITLNAVSAWVNARTSLATWGQAIGLSLATFLILLRLTENAFIEVGLLSLLAGVLVYGLLRVPTVGGILSLTLIFIPLLAHSPSLGLLWFILLIVAASRLNSREIMLLLVVIVAAGSPFGWLAPLLIPWWFRARRSALPMALGVTYAMIFSMTLGWSNAGGLLPVPTAHVLQEFVAISPFDTTFLGLFEPGVWDAWGNLATLQTSITGTFSGLGSFFAETFGTPLLVATAWAMAATLTVSNRRNKSPYLRGMGIGLGAVVLLVAHLLPARGEVIRPETATILFALFGVALSVGLSQWPLQADPNKGNKTGTVLRLLRQTLGAFYMALGVGFFAPLVISSPTYGVLLVGGVFGTLAMITNPLIGPPLVFASLVAAYAPIDPGLTVVVAVLLFVYVGVNFFFDRRRPRRWNPLGAGLIIGAPGLARLGMLPMAVLGIGALEAQVPATILALTGHVLLIAVVKPSPLGVIVQLVVTLGGILVVERLMGLALLKDLNHKIRRLIFTVSAAIIMAIGYYTLGEVAAVPVVNAVILAVITSAALVGAMGDRAIYWRRFIERDEEEEEITEDDEVTGVFD